MLSKSEIKDIQSLQHKKFRDTTGSFTAEGPKVVNELLQQGIFKTERIYALNTWAEKNETLTQHFQHHLTIINDSELNKISGLNTPNQVVALFKKKPEIPLPDLSGALHLMLDGIQDPGNLGTIIRTADWFGIKNIFCSLDTADVYNSKVVQSTMASIGRVEVIYTELEILLKENRALKSFAAALDGQSLMNISKPEEGMIIIGNESKGISPSILSLASEKITIPKTGEAESLNAAIAAAIILYQFTTV